MKHTKGTEFCPGCKKHCPAHAHLCKFGRQYFEKHPVASCEKACKWEAYTEKGGFLWHFFLVSKNLKNALRKEKVKEEVITGRLSAEERELFLQLLKKMDERKE